MFLHYTSYAIAYERISNSLRARLWVWVVLKVFIFFKELGKIILIIRLFNKNIFSWLVYDQITNQITK